MTEAYESIRRGLREAIDFAAGKPSGAVVHRIAVSSTKPPSGCPEPVEGTAPAPGCPKPSSHGASAWPNQKTPITLSLPKGWEHGRRRPTSPAQVLLAMIAKRPSLVGELLR